GPAGPGPSDNFANSAARDSAVEQGIERIDTGSKPPRLSSKLSPSKNPCKIRELGLIYWNRRGCVKRRNCRGLKRNPWSFNRRRHGMIFAFLSLLSQTEFIAITFFLSVEADGSSAT
ncbi:MAG: hypothetical protein WBE78_10020, partial [Candidatus Binataceae bacterium]